MPPKRKGGIRQRLGIAQRPVPPRDDVPDAMPVQPPHRRGGIRARMHAAKSKAKRSILRQEEAKGPLVKTLKRKWGLGKISAKDVAEIFHGAKQQGASNVPTLSSLDQPQHLHRSLVAAFGHPQGAPEFFWAEIPTKGGPTMHPFLLPHLWFAALFVGLPDLFRSSVRGAGNAAKKYWQKIQHTEFFQKHPGLSSEHLERTIPIGMHGDGGAFSHQDSLFVLTWNSLIGGGNTRANRYLMTILKKSEMVDATLPAVMEILAWSFNVMLTGLMPVLDWLGRTIEAAGYLAGGFRACMGQLRGDWEFFTVLCQFPKWNEKLRMCWKCQAEGNNESELKYSRFDRYAPWRATRLTHELYVWLQERANVDLPVIFQKIIGFRIEQVMSDSLHTVELGVGSHILGNIMWECVTKHAFGGSTIATNINLLDAKMKQWMKDKKIKHRFRGKLTKDKLRTDGGWPKLKSKAAPVRSLAQFAVDLAEEHLDESRAVVARQLVRFYEILNENGLFLTDAAKTEIAQVGSRLCRRFAALSSSSVDAGIKLWKCTPKLHLFLHMCEWDIEFGNPRYFWTYSDEDMVGQMIKAGESCHPRTMAIAGMYKWLTVVFVEHESTS